MWHGPIPRAFPQKLVHLINAQTGNMGTSLHFSGFATYRDLSAPLSHCGFDEEDSPALNERCSVVVSSRFDRPLENGRGI